MLEIRRQGKLIETYWSYDKELKKGEYRERDVTDVAFSKLFDVCALEKGVILRDILCLLDKHLTIFNAVLGNWCEELVEEGLLGKEPEEPETEIEYLELYWHFSKRSEDDSEFHGYQFPGFHGIGFERITDEIDRYGNVLCQAGDRINYAVEMTPLNDLAILPVKLNPEIKIYDESYKEEPVALTESGVFTLGHILYGIVWELSFFGSPKMRDKKKDELNDTIKGIEEGTIKTVSWDSLDDDSDDSDDDGIDFLDELDEERDFGGSD